MKRVPGGQGPRAVRRVGLLCSLLALLLLLSACGATTANVLQDGYYTAEAAAFDSFGWKEYITICVRDTKIVTVEYNAKNESGFIKSWDMDYMREMNEVDGTYPNEYTRIYADALQAHQQPEQVDAISGATHSHNTFQMLATAAIEQARQGDKEIAFVEIPSYE